MPRVACYVNLRNTQHVTIQRELQDPLAMALLSGEFGEGDTVRIDYHEESVVFKRV